MIYTYDHVTQVGLDGLCNVWIMKPGGLSRGRGITLETNLAQVGF